MVDDCCTVFLKYDLVKFMPNHIIRTNIELVIKRKKGSV